LGGDLLSEVFSSGSLVMLSVITNDVSKLLAATGTSVKNKKTEVLPSGLTATRYEWHISGSEPFDIVIVPYSSGGATSTFSKVITGIKIAAVRGRHFSEGDFERIYRSVTTYLQ